MSSSLTETLLIIFVKWFVTLRIFWATVELTLADFLEKKDVDGKTMDTNLPWEFHTDMWKGSPGGGREIPKWSVADVFEYDINV